MTRRRRATPDAAAQRRAALDRALREMLRDCPVPDELRDLVDKLGDEAGEQPRRKRNDG